MKVLNAIRIFAKDNDTAILTGIAIAGVVSTGIFAGRSAIKAEKVLEEIEKEDITKKEKLKTVAPIFMPPIICGMVTIACIYASHSIDARKQLAWASAYSMSEHAMKTIEDKLGDKKVRSVKDSIFEEDLKKNPPNPENIIDTGKGKTLFRDGVFGGDFYSDIEYVKSVFNKFNDLLNKGEDIYVNDIRWELGLPQTDSGYVMRWRGGQLNEHLSSLTYIDKNLQECTDEDVKNIFVLSYKMPREEVNEFSDS